MKESRIGLRLTRHFKSIQSTIFAGVAMLVLSAVLIVTAVSVQYTDSAIFENSLLYTQTITKQINQNIDSYITYMDNIVSVISGSEDAQYYLFRENTDGGHKKRLLEQFRIILKGRSDIRNIGLVCDGGTSLFNTGYPSQNPDLDLSTQEWYRKAVGNTGQSILTSSHVQHVIEGERPWVITMSRGISNIVGSRASNGAVFIDLNYSAISELCDQNSIGDKGYVFIVDQDGNIVYHPQQQQLYNELQTENIDAVMNSDTDTVTIGKGEHEKIYTISRSDKTGWTVVGCMNVAELLKSSRQAQRIYVICAAGLIVLALILSRVLARNITYPIQRLRDSMQKVQTGDFPATDIEVSSENEIGSLTESFNVMTHRIEELMEQNIHERSRKEKVN